MRQEADPATLAQADAEPPASAARARGPGASLKRHAVARFEGPASRRHDSLPLYRLRLNAWRQRLRRPRRLVACHTFVQFAGYPRSGHSLIGAMLDAHPGALISHELDAMGLLAKNMDLPAILRLVDWHAANFARNGRWWNGFCYDVERPAPDPRPGVIGDKKGDWAVRWTARDPGLPDRLEAATDLDCKWILVTRHPLDNVATMSLRLGRAYDRIRIAHRGDRAAAREAIARAQSEGEIARDAQDEAIADFRALSAAVAMLKAGRAAENWHQIVYEDFVADPRASLSAAAGFLGLAADPAWLDAAAAIVRGGGSKSRDKVRWTDAQRAALKRCADAHDFLEPYRDAF